MKHYAWTDVRRIETDCTRGGRNGGWSGSYMLTMRDGARIDLLETAGPFVDAYPRMSRALEQGDYSFDSSEVAPNCDLAFVSLLRHQPPNAFTRQLRESAEKALRSYGDDAIDGSPNAMRASTP